MKAVVQRVSHARVLVEGEVRGSVGAGLLVYLGVARGDTEKDAVWLAEKIVNLRIFNDEAGKMNVSILEKKAACPDAAVLAVSQFTLLGECVKGRRPYYGGAAEPETAKPLYEYVMEKIREKGIRCESGVFQAHMQVESINDGPVTILLDSALAFAV